MRDEPHAALGRGLRAEHHREVLVRAFTHQEIALSEVRADDPRAGRSESLPGDAAYGVAVQLRDYPVHEWWEDGRRAPTTRLRAGDVTIYDLRRDPRFEINNPFHSIHVRLPRATLDAASRQLRAGSSDLRYAPGEPLGDATLAHLLLALRPVFREPEAARGLFLDGVATAIIAHVVARYGAGAREPARARGGLAPRDRERALGMLDAGLDADPRISDIAAACDLSMGHFIRAFRATFGVTPHRWLVSRRVERAETLLRGDGSLGAIALACGFADQSHFTRVFTRQVGCPPGAWRRQQRGSARTRVAD